MHVKVRNLEQEKMHQGTSGLRNKMGLVMLFVSADADPYIL